MSKFVYCNKCGRMYSQKKCPSCGSKDSGSIDLTPLGHCKEDYQ